MKRWEESFICQLDCCRLFYYDGEAAKLGERAVKVWSDEADVRWVYSISVSYILHTTWNMGCLQYTLSLIVAAEY